MSVAGGGRESAASGVGGGTVSQRAVSRSSPAGTRTLRCAFSDTGFISSSTSAASAAVASGPCSRKAAQSTAQRSCVSGSRAASHRGRACAPTKAPSISTDSPSRGGVCADATRAAAYTLSAAYAYAPWTSPGSLPARGCSSFSSVLAAAVTGDGEADEASAAGAYSPTSHAAARKVAPRPERSLPPPSADPWHTSCSRATSPMRSEAAPTAAGLASGKRTDTSTSCAAKVSDCAGVGAAERAIRASVRT
mmetsp:Transcript_11553/g.48537  ORF Transcript_11553/g.48537 Transcript_11553/m.48537 type:complete len:250 (+) Transcript_11553:184-933(+)